MNIKTEIYTSINTIPKHYWDDLSCASNIYYSPDFLKAFECGNKAITFNYIFITRHNKAIAFANTQLVKINIKTITKNIKLKPWLKQITNRLLCKTEIKVLFCGNVFLSGEYGTFLKQDENKPETFIALTQGIEMLKKRSKGLHGIFVKDFLNDSLKITSQLNNFNYTAMQVEPNMIIKLNNAWNTFEDYKTALKSKYRVKANKADSKSKDLTVRFLNEREITSYQEALQQLYQNTINNADFNAQVLNLKTYSYLKKTFPDQFFVKGYFYNNDLVGFLSAMKNGTHLDAHFIGIDYSRNRDFAIYPRILNDYVRLGISTQAHQINLGRTASEIKSTLGASPQTLTCYFKHKNRTVNSIVKPLIKRVSIKTFKQHQPFK